MLLTDLDLLRKAVDKYAAEDERRKAAGIGRKFFDGKGLQYLVAQLPEIDPKDLIPTVTTEINLYDKEEIHHNCTVQVWMNTETGQTSIGWWPEGNPSPGAEDL